MSTHSGDDGHPCSCVLLPIGLTDVNNVIIYDEFSNSHDGSQCFHIMLILPLDPMLESGGLRGKFRSTMRPVLSRNSNVLRNSRRTV